jgi:hypothetical protein
MASTDYRKAGCRPFLKPPASLFNPVRNRPLVRFLLDRGADASSSLWAVVWRDDAELCRMLLAAKPRLDLRAHGETPLFFAARLRRLKTLELLIAAGADPTVTDSDGRDAVALAACLAKSSSALRIAPGRSGHPRRRIRTPKARRSGHYPGSIGPPPPTVLILDITPAAEKSSSMRSTDGASTGER